VIDTYFSRNKMTQTQQPAVAQGAATEVRGTPMP
jgi:hypothetical protein